MSVLIGKITGEPGRSPVDDFPSWQKKIIFKTKRGTKINAFLCRFFLKFYYRKHGLIYGKIDEAIRYICSDKMERSYITNFYLEQCKQELKEELALLHEKFDDFRL